MTPQTSAVHSPAHYTTGGIEAIDYIRAKLGPQGFRAYCLGNVLKYVSRADHKGGDEDLHKAAVYLGWAIDFAPVLPVEALSVVKKAFEPFDAPEGAPVGDKF